MDSHEAGAQNWTDDMLEEFARRRGYDFRPYLPLMAGYCVARMQRMSSPTSARRAWS